MLDGLANDALVSQVEEAKFRVLAGEFLENVENPMGENPPRLFFVRVVF